MKDYANFMMDIYLKLRDPDMISILQAGWRFVSTSINFLAGPRRASVAFEDRGLNSSSKEHWRFVGSSGIVEYQGSHHGFVWASGFSVGQFFLVVAIA